MLSESSKGRDNQTKESNPKIEPGLDFEQSNVEIVLRREVVRNVRFTAVAGTVDLDRRPSIGSGGVVGIVPLSLQIFIKQIFARVLAPNAAPIRVPVIVFKGIVVVIVTVTASS